MASAMKVLMVITIGKNINYRKPAGKRGSTFHPDIIGKHVLVDWLNKNSKWFVLEIQKYSHNKDVEDRELVSKSKFSLCGFSSVGQKLRVFISVCKQIKDCAPPHTLTSYAPQGLGLSLCLY